MNSKEVARFFERRAELEVIKVKAQERLNYVSDETLKNNLRCDHKHADGGWAESREDGICLICGCGMGYQHYLETQT